MKLLILIIALCLPGLKEFCQEENVIKFKSEVTLTLTKAGNGKYDYKITEIKDFDKIIETSGRDLFKNKLDTDQVKLFFCTGKFGYDNATVLVIRSGLKISLSYSAKIKREGADDFEKTSVEPLYPNVKSIEEWPYHISEIILSDFSVMEN